MNLAQRAEKISITEEEGDRENDYLKANLMQHSYPNHVIKERCGKEDAPPEKTAQPPSIQKKIAPRSRKSHYLA